MSEEFPSAVPDLPGSCLIGEVAKTTPPSARV